MYSHPDHPKTVLLKYSGDEAKDVNFAHGNATKTTRYFVRTHPSVIQKIKESSGTARQVYQDLILTGTSDITSSPRNQEQVRNALKATRNQQRLTRDALYNLHEFAYDTNFVRHFATLPDFSYISVLFLFYTLLMLLCVSHKKKNNENRVA